MRLSRITVMPTIMAILSFGSMRGQSDVDLLQAYRDLSQEGVLMDLSAHPDDEDGATLAYYRKALGYKTYSVLFTRGEGGQNEKGPELYEELGVLRSAETRAAGKILGTEVYFLNFLDFGFSKTATETYRKWGGQTEALRRLVYMIRKLKPDVLFTNHNTIDGHGNHQAVAITAIAAFDAAADTSMFPEQLREPGIIPWQPRKLFFRSFGRYESTADVSNPINQFDSLRGLGYLDIATNALRMHKTQGMERANLRAFTRGKSLYRLVRSDGLYDPDTTNFFGGIHLLDDPSAAALRPVKAELATWRPDVDRKSLLSSAAAVLGRLDSIEGRPGVSSLERRMVDHWREEIERIVIMRCGIQSSMTVDDPVLVAREKSGAALAVSAANCTIGDFRVQWLLPPGWAMNEKTEAAPELSPRSVKRWYTIQVGDKPVFTQPTVRAQYRPLNAEEKVSALLHYTLDGRGFVSEVPASFDVAPPEAIDVSPEASWFPLAKPGKGRVFTCRVRNYLPHKTAGRIRIETPPGWMADGGEYVIPSEDSSASVSMFVRAPDTVRPGEYTLHFRTNFDTKAVTVGVFDASVARGIRVGVIESYDNTLETALNELGVPYALITDQDLIAGRLSAYTTIVVDIRAYLVRDELKKQYRTLLEYVKAGGNLVVMYQRDREWKSEYAPYPFSIGRSRVTVEEAPITVLVPHHPLMTTPNAITPRDWEGWKQERGLYFPTDVSPEYAELLSCNDPGEPPLKTGYLVAGYGKGTYIYTSYVWYRQLKEGNAGAFRCFANMISYPSVKK